MPWRSRLELLRDRIGAHPVGQVTLQLLGGDDGRASRRVRARPGARP